MLGEEAMQKYATIVYRLFRICYMCQVTCMVGM